MKLQENTKEKKSISLLWLVLVIISTILILVINIEKEYSNVVIVKTILLNGILNSILTFFIVEKRLYRGGIPYLSRIVIGSYILSFLLILCTKGNIEYHIWLYGCIIISALIYVNLGYIILFQSVFLASFLGQYTLEQVISLLILGVVLCILAEHMKEVKLLKYIILIVVFLDLILEFVINDFLIKNLVQKEILITIIIDVILVVATYMISRYYENWFENQSRKFNQEKDSSKIDNSKTNIQNVQAKNIMYNDDSKIEIKKFDSNDNTDNTVLDKFINPDFILLKELNSYSNNLYQHSKKVGKLSFLAAKEIGVNEKLALVGGLYHEIGRIREGDYVQEGITLIKKYNMPSEIEDIIRGHNIKYAKPTSPEGAIVMLTVSILATKEILENNSILNNEKQNNEKQNRDIKNSMPMKKIIENVFDMRLSKHSLDDSGLTIYQFNHLKQFYTTHILSIIES